MRFFEIKKNLFLVEQPVNTASDVKKVSESTNHVWIYDRSYSMSGELEKLSQDLISKSQTIPYGDTLSLGWFSGEGQFNFIIKGFKITADSDFVALKKIIENNKHPVSMTCFSEILNETDGVIRDLSAFSERFSLMFMSDGYPVVSNYSREIENIFSAIEKIEGRITASFMIGYGNYYNRDLMMDMAERLGGSLIHSHNLPEFSVALTNLIDKSSDSLPKVKVEFNKSKPSLGVIFGIDKDTLNVYKQKEDGSIGFIPTEDNNNVYFLTDKISTGMEQVTVLEHDLLRPSKKSSLIRAIYGASCLLSQKTKTDLAMETVASIGDKNFVKLLTNSYTNAEYGNVETMLKEAMHSTKSRIIDGYDPNFLPPEDAFCLLDLLELMMGDSEAFFYPYNPNFKYKRIGLKAKVIGKFPDFKPVENVKCKLSELSWNKKMLNLSLMAKISGSVNLKTGYKDLGLNKNFPTIIYRNYTVVKDGMLNMNTLPVSMSKNTFEAIQSKGLLIGHTFEENHIYDLPLSALPVMNRATAKKNTSASELAKKAIKEAKLEATMKVLNDFNNSLEEPSNSSDTFTEEQRAFLEENGISHNGFSPKTEKEDPVDFYHAKEFVIEIKGCSSLPKVSDVKTKLASNKPLTPREGLLQEGLVLLDNAIIKTSADSVKKAWIADLISKTKKDLMSTRFDVQKTKFAILLGKQWFDEFESREECSLEVDGFTVNFKIKETQVSY
jgi:hypothetical protein